MDMAHTVTVILMVTITAGTVHGFTVHTIIQVITVMDITTTDITIMATMVMEDTTGPILATDLMQDPDLQTTADIITVVYHPDLHMDTAVLESTQVLVVERPMHWAMIAATEAGNY